MTDKYVTLDLPRSVHSESRINKIYFRLEDETPLDDAKKFMGDLEEILKNLYGTGIESEMNERYTEPSKIQILEQKLSGNPEEYTIEYRGPTEYQGHGAKKKNPYGAFMLPACVMVKQKNKTYDYKKIIEEVSKLDYVDTSLYKE